MNDEAHTFSMNSEFEPALETDLYENLGAIMTLLYEHFEESTSLIEEGLEHNLAFAQYAEVLTAALHDEPTHEAWQVVYRALHFAYVVSGIAGLDSSRMQVQDDFSEQATDQALRDKLIVDSNDYMAVNRSLDVLTSTFMPEIDPGGRYNDSAEIVVALASRQIERGNQNDALERLLAD